MSVFSSTNHWDHHNNHTTRHPEQSAFMPDVTAFTPIWGQEQAPPPIVSYPDLMAAGFQCAADLAIWPRSQMGGLVSQRMSPRGGLPAPHSASTSTTCTTKKTRRRVASLAQRRAANIRERRRMFNLNEAFDKLRRKVPTFAYEKRLSRIETLRLAITYISFMTELMSGGNPDGRNNDIYSPPAIVAAETNGESHPHHHHHHHHNNMNNGHHHNHINNNNNNNGHHNHHHHNHNHHHHLHHDHQSISREFISSFSQSG